VQQGVSLIIMAKTAQYISQIYLAVGRLHLATEALVDIEGTLILLSRGRQVLLIGKDCSEFNVRGRDSGLATILLREVKFLICRLNGRRVVALATITTSHLSQTDCRVSGIVSLLEEIQRL